jgi:hypothetical protein
MLAADTSAWVFFLIYLLKPTYQGTVFEWTCCLFETRPRSCPGNYHPPVEGLLRGRGRDGVDIGLLDTKVA